MSWRLVIAFLFLGLNLQAQQYFFQTFGQDEGIPVSTINDIVEDDLGFMWIATEGGGLARFDGLHSQVFNTENAAGIPSNYITRLHFKTELGLLIGTDKGLVLYNGFTFQDVWNLPKERVVAFTFVDEELFVVYRRSIWKVSPDSTTTSWDFEDDVELMSVCATNSDLFIGASNGVYRKNGEEWEKWWNGTNVRSIFDPNPNEDGSAIQVGAADDVYLILRKGVGLKNLSSSGDGGAHPDVRDIVLDSRGRWWYGSYLNGLRRYDSQLPESVAETRIGEEQGLTTPKVRCLHVSTDGRIWIGGLTGLSRLVEPDLFRINKSDGLADDRIHAVALGSNGDLWMGGLSGLSRRKYRGDVESFTSSSGLPRGLIFDVVETKSGDIYIATENGLVRRTRTGFRTYGEENGLGNAFIFDLEPLSSGGMAVATTEGIYIFANGRFRVLDINLTTTAFTRIQEDNLGRLWVLDIEGRILQQQGEGWKNAFKEDLMLRISPATFQVDQEGTLWMGTNGHGLWRLDSERLDSITASQGLISDNVWSLDVDAGDVWIGTESGIQNIVWNRGWGFGARVSNARGIGETECNPHAVVRSDESIIFGTNAGVIVAPLRRDNENVVPGKLQLTALDLYFEQPETWSLWSTSVQPWSGMPQSLELPWDQNYLRFSYAALQVADPLSLQYQYKMSPLNSEWTAAEGRTEAIYTSVPPGKYTFEVKAFDPISGKSLYSEPYTFVIRSPFWKTWWFYVIVGLVLAASVWLYIRVRFQRINARLKLEEERNDLERRALRLQMNPHFVFNALDAISGFIFKNEPKEAVKYLNNFAKLMRLMLESSREHVIPVHTEIQLLENYLALEKLRFSGSFESEIIIDDDLDTYGFSMPSMMVQPHVENAILHGLRPTGGGKVTITFTEVEGSLKCVVEDNGVGRKKSAELNEKSGRTHRSLAGEISRRRVELFERTFGGRSAVITEDLYDENGDAAGTRVLLQLPLQSVDEWDDE